MHHAVAGAVVRRACGSGTCTGSRRFRLGDGHVDLGAQRPARRPGTRPRACARRGRGSPRPAGRDTGSSRPGSVRVPRYSRISSARQVVHVGLARLDQLHGPVVELLEVVGGVVEVLAPVEAEPADVVHGWRRRTPRSSFVGFVSSKRRWQRPPNSRARPKFEADRLGVADVQIAVRLGRKARDHAAVPAPAAGVLRHDRADEVGAAGRLGFGHGVDPTIAHPMGRSGARHSNVCLPKRVQYNA